jgi:hypothetical protein
MTPFVANVAVLVGNFNECFNEQPCDHGACIQAIGSYTCKCFAGYGGTHCEIDVNECFSNPCQNGAPCTGDLQQPISFIFPGTEAYALAKINAESMEPRCVPGYDNGDGWRRLRCGTCVPLLEDAGWDAVAISGCQCYDRRVAPSPRWPYALQATVTSRFVPPAPGCGVGCGCAFVIPTIGSGLGACRFTASDGTINAGTLGPNGTFTRPNVTSEADCMSTCLADENCTGYETSVENPAWCEHHRLVPSHSEGPRATCEGQPVEGYFGEKECKASVGTCDHAPPSTPAPNGTNTTNATYSANATIDATNSTHMSTKTECAARQGRGSCLSSAPTAIPEHCAKTLSASVRARPGRLSALSIP